MTEFQPTTNPNQNTSRWDPRLIEAAIAMNDNRLDVAERILKPYLKDDPFDVYAIRLLAELAGRIGRWRDSESLLRRAVELAPGWTAAKANLALVLGRTGRPGEALEMLDEVVAAEPQSLSHQNLKAATLARVGDFEEAIGLYAEILERAPMQPKLWTGYGHILKTVGRLDDGIAAYRKALELKPELGEAWWSLANLKTVRFSNADIAAMVAALETPDLADEDRFHLDFALGKALHDAGRHADAFAHFEAGNARRLELHPYDRQDISNAVSASVRQFSAKDFGKREGGCVAREPIFIVGMPRAGSTLIEQILSSHSMVEGTTELPDIPILARRGGHYPASALELNDTQRRELGEEYLKRASVQRRTDKPYFIDKLPNNWLFVPFIQLILPNATIIDARRHPMACGFSNFRQHFARGQNFAYDLADIGAYYADYVRLMAHVDTVLPGRVHRVIYEQLVEDNEAQVRALLDHVGLPFETACLEFYNTERAVRTPSSEQVRQPIYKSSGDDWRPYGDFLDPLAKALGTVLDHYPQVPRDILATLGE